MCDFHPIRSYLRSLLLGAPLAALVGVASVPAADLTPKTYVKAPAALAPAYDWTGFYVGVNGGGAWARTDVGLGILDNIYNAQATALVLGNGNYRINEGGGLAGGQFGYLWQSGAFVGGLEGSIDWMGTRQSVTQNPVPVSFGFRPFYTFSDSVKTDWLALLLGRAGVDFNGWLPYVTGGLAVTHVSYSSVFTDVETLLSSNASISQTRAGWAVGAGLEYRIAHNWSLRGEYLYADFGSISGTSPLVPAFGRVLITPPTTSFQHSVGLRENIARVAVSYHFGDPVVAKY
jgi:outer membrane immunogenic protein